MPVDIRGTSYRTVSERIVAAHGDTVPVGIKSVATEFCEVGGELLALATVVFVDGRSFLGHVRVTLDATGNKPESLFPHEVAETSAVGRALAMAGYPGSDQGIAGAEEVQSTGRAPRRESAPAPRKRTQNAVASRGAASRPTTQGPPARPQEAHSEPYSASPEWDALTERAAALGIRTASTTPPPAAMVVALARLQAQVAAKAGDAADEGSEPCAIAGCGDMVFKYDEGGSGLCEQHTAMAEAAVE